MLTIIITLMAVIGAWLGMAAWLDYSEERESVDLRGWKDGWRGQDSASRYSGWRHKAYRAAHARGVNDRAAYTQANPRVVALFENIAHAYAVRYQDGDSWRNWGVYGSRKDAKSLARELSKLGWTARVDRVGA